MSKLNKKGSGETVGIILLPLIQTMIPKGVSFPDFVYETALLYAKFLKRKRLRIDGDSVKKNVKKRTDAINDLESLLGAKSSDFSLSRFMSDAIYWRAMGLRGSKSTAPKGEALASQLAEKFNLSHKKAAEIVEFMADA